MSEPIQQPDTNEPEGLTGLDELALLKRRADTLGITYSNNIGVEKLKERIEEALEKTDGEVPAPKAEASSPSRADQIREATRLIRIRYSNMNPMKNELPGEYFTVANNVIGTVKKFVPYGAASEVGYHVPYVIFKMMKRRTFTVSKMARDDHGRPYQTKAERKEFAIEILEPLTKKELDKLAADQRAAGRV